MSEQPNQYHTLIAGADLSATSNDRCRLKLSSGKVVLAGASDDYIGILQGTAAENAGASVRLRNGAGTYYMRAAGSFTAGSTLYAAASGKVDDSGDIKVGVAMTASTGDDDIVDVMPFPDDLTVPAEGVTLSTLAANVLALWDRVTVACADNADGTLTATIQLTDADGEDVAAQAIIPVWTSATAGAAVEAATEIAATTGIILDEAVANGLITGVTDSNGALVLTVTDGDGEVFVNAAAGARVTSDSATISGN